MSHIRLENLTIAYGKHKVLQDLTVDIPDGKIIAVIGPSGCGKTTLLKSMNRLLDLYDDVEVSGKVLIDGLNIYDQNSDVIALRKKVGFLPQRPYPLPMSIYDNIAFGPRIHGVDNAQILGQIAESEKQNSLLSSLFINEKEVASSRKRKAMDLLVEHYLKLAGLWDEVKDRLHTPASKLSIGQQQRLALARTLTIEPEVILADEPTSALDPISAKLVEQQFKVLKKKYTIIIVTHILRQAKRVADYVIFLFMGEMVEHGCADTFFNSQQDERTRAYISGEFN